METLIGIFSESFWYWAPVLVTLTVAISGAINGAFNITTPIWKQVLSWVIGSGLSVAAYFLSLITMGDPQFVGVIALCAVVGLSSNGIYDIPVIKQFVDGWFLNTKK